VTRQETDYEVINVQLITAKSPTLSPLPRYANKETKPPEVFRLTTLCNTAAGFGETYASGHLSNFRSVTQCKLKM
jgi:hypothetical protein